MNTVLASPRKDRIRRREDKGEIEISGALSIRALRIAMRTAAPSMVSAVQTPVTPTRPLTASITRSHSPVEAPTEEETFRPFGPTDEPVDTSGLFGSFGGISGEETGDSLFMVEEEPAH